MLLKKMGTKAARGIAFFFLLAVTGLIFAGCGGAPPVNKGWSGVSARDGRLFLGDMNRSLVAVSQENGTKLWSVKLESEKSKSGIFAFLYPVVTEAIYGTPVLEEDLVYVGTYIRSGSRESSKVYAFTAEKGEERWLFPRVGTLDGAIVGGLAASRGRVYFGTTSGSVSALDGVTGERKWEFKTGGQIWGAPLISGDTLFIGSFDKNLYAIDLAAGKEKWRFASDGPIVAKPALQGNTLYFGTYNRHFFAVDAATGTKKWEFASQTRKGFLTSPLVKDSVVYAPSLDGRVYVLDTASGQDLTTASPIKLDRFASSSPLALGDSVIVAASNGRVYAINTRSYQAEPIKELKETVHSPLFAESGVIYIHSQIPDTLHAVSTQGGTLWSLSLKRK